MNTPLDPKIDALIGKLHDHFKFVASFEDKETAKVTRCILRMCDHDVFYVAMDGADAKEFGHIETFLVHENGYGYIGVFNNIDADNKLVFVDRDRQVAFPENGELIDQMGEHHDLLDRLDTVPEAQACIDGYIKWVQSVVHNAD